MQDFAALALVLHSCTLIRVQSKPFGRIQMETRLGFLPLVVTL
jgi:hypothetical protein